MFDNIGGKIKTLAKISTVIGSIASLLLGLIMLISSVIDYYNNWMIASGLAVMIVGPLAFWIGSFILYGFGELIENTTVIAELAAKADAEKNKEE